MTRPSPTSTVMDLLEQVYPTDLAGRVKVELPDTGEVPAQGQGFYAQVFHFGGDSDQFEQRPTMDISVFGRGWKATERMAFRVEGTLLGYPHRVSSGERVVVIDRVSVPSSPTELPWDGEADVTRFNMTVQLVLRG